VRSDAEQPVSLQNVNHGFEKFLFLIFVNSQILIIFVSLTTNKKNTKNKKQKKQTNRIGDTMVRINGTLMSTNCDLPGFSHPAAIVMNHTSSRIVLLGKGEQLKEGTNVLCNSPLLVMKGEFAIPELVAQNVSQRYFFFCSHFDVVIRTGV
jgi:hypothetical protein